MVLKVIGAVVTGLLALGGAGLIARGNPEPPPPVEMKCPPFEERKAPRSAFCERLDQLEELLGELQSKERARREREEREKKMLAQEPPTLKP